MSYVQECWKTDSLSKALILPIIQNPGGAVYSAPPVHPGMKLAYFLSSVVAPAVSVVGQIACSTTGAFTSYTDPVLKAFYYGN
jgi:hypothetical protein